MRRVGMVLAAGVAVMLLGALGCKRIEHERRDLANQILSHTPKCKGWAGGRTRSSLVVFCEGATTDYVKSSVLPAVSTACDDLNRLDFEDITVYGPAGSKLRWAGPVTSAAGCTLASN